MSPDEKVRILREALKAARGLFNGSPMARAHVGDVIEAALAATAEADREMLAALLPEAKP
jgi:hypothetical protein